MLFVKREDAHKAVRAMNRKEVSVQCCVINCMRTTIDPHSFLVVPSNAAWQLITAVLENLLKERTTRTKLDVMNVG